MNDRFKFRVAIRQEDGSYRVCEVATIAWRSDKTIVEYDYVADAKHGKIGTIVIDGENAILEQCTGLTDKNGKLVFEGDVVMFAGVKMSVEWGVKTCRWVLRYAHKKHTHYGEAMSLVLPEDQYPNEYTIIGNVHKMELEK